MSECEWVSQESVCECLCVRDVRCELGMSVSTGDPQAEQECEKQPETETEEEKEKEEEEKSVFLAFARVYSGTLHRGQALYLLHPRYDPRSADLTRPNLSSTTEAANGRAGQAANGGAGQAANGGTGEAANGGAGEGEDRYWERVKVAELYILMGRSVMEVDTVPAGNILGIAGLDDQILKSATISTTLACPAFRPMSFAAAPILRVAVEPLHASGTAALSRGMKLLNQADASVEISLQASGEFILATAGEVHLQRCLDDLQDTFAKVKLSVSSPIVPFRETIVPPPKVDTLNEVISDDNVVRLAPTNPRLRERERSDDGMVAVQTPNKACTLSVQAKPLPEKVTQLLSNSSALLKALYLTTGSAGGKPAGVLLNTETLSDLQTLRTELKTEFESDEKWAELSADAVERIWAFGPKGTGANVLICGLADFKRGSVWRGLEGGGLGGPQGYDHSLVYGFQLACQAGPLCEEPLRGVGFILRGWSFTGSEGERDGVTKPPSSDIETHSLSDSYGPFSGQLISTMKEGCRRAILAQPARLMAAMYSCDILATAEVLGRLYAVLGRRNGRVCAEEMREGSTVFSVQAVVPVAESFGFAEEVRKKTSGLASPQLVFSHWEVCV